MARVILALIVMTSLAACGTRLNPFNWFGPATETRVAAEPIPDAPADPRQLVAEVVDLVIAPTGQGAILRATGRAPVQGFWEAKLIEIARDATSLTYEFRVFPPLTQTATGTPQSRELVTGLHLSQADLSGIQSITVIGAENRRMVRRR